MSHPDSMVQRIKLSNEWHARPVANLATPFRCTHQVIKRCGSAAESRRQFAELCKQHDQSAPSDESRHHVVQMGSALIKWEGHTEADSITHLIPGNGAPLFSEAAKQFSPTELAKCFGDDVICGVHIEVLKQAVDVMDMEAIRAALGSTKYMVAPLPMATLHCGLALG